MKIDSAFWDASAVVPLCCPQSTTSAARRLSRNNRKMIVWWGTPVEVRSSFARLIRQKVINPQGFERAARIMETLRQSWREVLPGDQLRALAEAMPERFGTRALDSFQLAAALDWCNQKPRNRLFICFDHRLARAAAEAGFTVLPE